jgi:hypothetical protein
MKDKESFQLSKEIERSVQERHEKTQNKQKHKKVFKLVCLD